MIDNFALAVSHGLMLLAAWRLLYRADLDDDSAPSTPLRHSWRRREPREDQHGA